MINVNFNLRYPKAKKSSLRIILRYNNQRYYYPIKERIEKSFWDSANQKAKKSYEGHMEFNERLKNVTRKIEKHYRAFLNNNDQCPPNKEQLIKLLDIAFDKTNSNKKDQSLRGYFNKYIEAAKTRINEKTGKPISINTLLTYNTTLKHFTDFEDKKHKTYLFEHIDLEFYNDFKDYLMTEVKLSTNAMGKNFQILKAILNDATERGINISTSYKSKRFKVMREESDNIYLSEDEINELYKCDLSENKKLEKVRDLFVVGCYTGLRFSDYSNIKPQNLTASGDIKIRISKTDETITVPILPIVKEILKKYKGELPIGISIQKTNEYLKDIAKELPMFKVNVGKSITKAGTRIDLTKAKWELLSTHTARRSFATNFYLKGYPTLAIMAITGHRTERAFLKYIKVSQFEQVNHFKKMAKKERILKIV